MTEIDKPSKIIMVIHRSKCSCAVFRPRKVDSAGVTQLLPEPLVRAVEKATRAGTGHDKTSVRERTVRVCETAETVEIFSHVI